MDKSGLKVCMVSIYPPTQGGVGTYTKEILSAYTRFTKSNLYITLLADRPAGMNKTSQETLTPNIAIKRVWTRNITYPLQIMKTLIREHPHLTHVHHEYFLYGGLLSSAIFPFFIILLKAIRLKVIVQIHGVIQLKNIDHNYCKTCELPSNEVLIKISRLGIFITTSLICKSADAIIVHANCLKETLVYDYCVNSEKIFVIRYGFAKPMITPKEAFLVRNKNVHEILFYGFLTGYKGLEILLAAHAELVEEMSNVHLRVVGGNSPRSKINHLNNLKQMTQKLGITDYVTFAGFKEPQDMGEYFTNAEIFVLPYIYSMASSDALSKAFQYLLPTVASDLGVLREELGCGKRGLLCQAGNKESLKDTIKYLLMHEAKRQSITESIYEHSLEFSWDTAAEEIYRLWAHLNS